MKNILLTIAFLSIIAGSFSQNSNTENLLKVQATIYSSRFPYYSYNHANIGINGLYRFSSTVDAGLAFGLGPIPLMSSNSITKGNYQVALAGIIEIHPIHWLIKEKDLKLDLYGSGKIGGSYDKPYKTLPKEINLYYGLHLGVAYYLKPRFGIFGQWGAEYNKQSYYSQHYGFTYRF